MLAATTWMFKTFSVKDWMAFSEVYGMPIRVAKYEPGVTTDDEKKSIKRALANLGHDAAALMPNTVELEILSGRTGSGQSPYLELAEYFDKQLSKGVLGQTMTSDDGSSLAQASVHENVRQDIAQADGMNLAATVMQYVIKPFVMLNFGPKAPVPKCYPETSPPEDLKAWSESAVPWVKAGLQVPAAFVRSKFAIPDPEPGEELVGGDLMRTPEEELMLQQQPQPGPQGPPGVPGQPPQGQPQPNRLALNAQEPVSVRTAEQTVDAAMREWQPILVPYKDTIEAMAQRAGSFAEFLELLKAFPETADSNEFVKQLAIAATETRIVAVGKA
jgi:phage gp29-like protein